MHFDSDSIVEARGCETEIQATCAREEADRLRFRHGSSW
jgi:hypothetical protein